LPDPDFLATGRGADEIGAAARVVGADGRLETGTGGIEIEDEVRFFAADFLTALRAVDFFAVDFLAAVFFTALRAALFLTAFFAVFLTAFFAVFFAATLTPWS
jgi:hypothetical protein